MGQKIGGLEVKANERARQNQGRWDKGLYGLITLRHFR